MVSLYCCGPADITFIFRTTTTEWSCIDFSEIDFPQRGHINHPIKNQSNKGNVCAIQKNFELSQFYR